MNPSQRVASTRWQRTEPSRFRLRFWAEEASANAFDLRSGATHCLSPLAAELLTLLAGDARTTTELAADLHDVFDDPAAACGLLHDELTHLGTIGLVAPAAPTS